MRTQHLLTLISSPALCFDLFGLDGVVPVDFHFEEPLLLHVLSSAVVSVTASAGRSSATSSSITLSAVTPCILPVLLLFLILVCFLTAF